MLFSPVILLRSRGESPKLFSDFCTLHPELFNEVCFLDGVSSDAESFKGSLSRFSEAGLAKGVEVTAGTG